VADAVHDPASARRDVPRRVRAISQAVAVVAPLGAQRLPRGDGGPGRVGLLGSEAAVLDGEGGRVAA
jgi:hypothetical protein